jgi:hypothetical protein
MEKARWNQTGLPAGFPGDDFSFGIDLYPPSALIFGIELL